MIHVLQYRPAFFIGFENDERDVANTADLLAIPWVAAWATAPMFKRWSLSDGQYLMAEMDDGKSWVAAILTGDPPDLPVWETND